MKIVLSRWHNVPHGLGVVARRFQFMVLLLAMLISGNLSADAPSHGKKVIGYFIEWGVYTRDYMVKDMPADKLTHVNFAFLAPFMLSGVYTQFSNIATNDYLKSDGSHPNQPLYVVGATTCSVNGVTYSVGLAVDDAWACFQKCNYPRRYQATPAYGWRTNVFSSWDMPTGEGVKGANDRTAGIFGELLGMKNAYPHIKIMPSLGGWSYSYYFCNIARTNASRQAFAVACRQTLDLFAGRDNITNLFDGVDLDWEFPYSGGDSAITHDPNDKEHLTALCQAIREQIGADKILTIASAQGYQNISNQYEETLQGYLDWVSIMAYDYNGYSWSPRTGFNAPLFGGDTNDPAYNPADGKYTVIDEAVQAFLGQGFNAINLILGLPFYGRTFGNVTNLNNGRFQSFSGPGIGSYESGVVEFNDICDGTAGNKILNRTSSGEWSGTNGYTRYWDATSQVPFLFNGNCWVSYDDDISLAVKAGYAMTHGFGGVMIWDMSCDTHNRTDTTSPDPYILINAVDAALKMTNGWLAIQVTPSSGSWRLSAPAGYTGPTSGTGNLAAVSAVTGEYGIACGALTGYVAPSNQTEFVTAGNMTVFAAVYLQISTNIGTPPRVSATDGTYTNKIRISWQEVAGATGYEIWRSQTNDADTAGRIADIPLIALRPFSNVGPLLAEAVLSNGGEQARALQVDPSSAIDASRPVSARGFAEARAKALQESTAYYYDDYAINPINSYYYWVRAKTGTLISPMSYAGMGYAALPPEEATGTADISADDFVYLPVNATNLSHAGTVSFRLGNNGPDALNSSAVAFDFHMGTNAASMVWIGSAQSNLTLSSGSEALVILGATAKAGLTVRGDLSGVQTVQVTVRHLAPLYDPDLANNTATAAGSVRVKNSGVNSIGRSFNDYDGDGKADLALCAMNGSVWAVLLSGTKYTNSVVAETGHTGWTGVPGDYEGDGKTDVGAYVPALSFWYVWLSDGGYGEYGYLGGPEFDAAQSDFDGDGKTDPVVYRERDGYWFGGGSANQYALFYTSLGGRGYEPVMADYDGDRRADPAVYNQVTGLWFFSLSSFGYQVVTGLFGDPACLPVPADYDGDGIVDPAIYAPATAYWQILLSSTLTTKGYYTLWGGPVGVAGGWPVPADYDGDGKADLAVYHQETGIWEGFLSAYGYQLIGGSFGGPEYRPVSE